MAAICLRANYGASFSGRLGSVAPSLLRLALSRSYGAVAAAAAAAAQPLLDESYHHYCYQSLGDRRRDWLGSASMADSEGSAPARGVQWAFIGNPSAKKHVYAQKLSELLEVPHISIASLVRQELSPRSSLYKQIANAVNQGRLVPENIIPGLLSKRLIDGYYRGETGFILDGIPRTQIQAEIIDQLADIDLVVNFKCTEDCLVKDQRHNIFPHSRDSHDITRPSSTSSHIELQCTRSKCPTDHNTEIVKKKIQVYAKQSKPLEDYYRKQRKLLDFQVGNAPAETWRGLLAALHLQHINAAHSSQKLTVVTSWL